MISKKEILLRELITEIEDVQFSKDQGYRLSKFLIDFAIEERDNQNSPYGRAIIYSAIRTGASMFRRDQVDLLIPLLGKGSVIDTTIVTLKMIGRIFEAQPPDGCNQYDNVSQKIVGSIKEHMYGLSARDAAHIQLAIFALAAIASNDVSKVIQTVLNHNNRQKWFNNHILRSLQELSVTWPEMHSPLHPEILVPLDTAIKELKEKRFN